MLSEQQQDYPYVVVNIRTHFRLIECRDNIQWILQRRDKNINRWRAFSYCKLKKSIVRIFDEHGLDTGLLDTRPERFESCFKTVQREQRQIHNLALVTATKELDAKSFSDEINADHLEVADHAA